MAAFKGFPEGKVRQTPIPEPLFSELLVEIDDLAEFKLTLYVFWRLNRMEGAIPLFATRRILPATRALCRV